MQQSYVGIHKIYLNRKGGGVVSEIEIRADTFKKIARHKMADINWTPTENIYRFFSKILRPICARVLFHQQPDTNEMEELSKVNIRAFNYFVRLHQNDLNDKSFWQEEYKCCELSQDTDEFFVHPIKFLCILSTSWSLVWSIPLHLNPSLYAGW